MQILVSSTTAPQPSLFLQNMNKIDKNQVWHDVLESIKVSVSPAIFSTWLSQTHLSSLKKVDDKRYVAEVGCQSSFVRTTVEQRYFGLIQDALIKTLGIGCDLLFITKQNIHTESITNVSSSSTPLFDQETGDEVFINKLNSARLRHFFTFENFAVSSSNQMAWAAAEAVAQNPGVSYNPLFLWGGVGVGKTHLMNAVGVRILKNNPQAKIFACTGEDFTNDIVSGIRNKTTQAFRDKYRKLTALFIDDIQFIAGKDTVQEEFFHTFNAITASGGQVILTSDRPPSDISKLEERLRSRFEAGLIVDIAPPDFELRCAIVQIKMREKQIDAPRDMEMEIVQLIAGNIDTARKIEGFLIRLSSETKLRNQPVTIDLVKTLVGKGMDEVVVKKNTTPDQVIDAVCVHFSTSKRALLGKARARIIARPRQMLMYLLRTELSLPLEEVGRIVGRDHTTVIHAVDKITQMASENVNTREDLLGIKKHL
jgi:chromosomal replication initiator protein